MFVEHSTTCADQGVCPDCGARITNGHLPHADTCPVSHDDQRQADTDREHGPRIRPASFSEREHLKMLGYTRDVARRVRVAVYLDTDGNPGARLFIHKGQIIAGVRDLGSAA
jgi:hypothetical protein